MKIPLFQGGGAIGDFKASWSDWRQAKILQRLTQRRAELEIKQAYESLVSSQEQFRALQEAVRTSDENYKLQQQDYALNLVNNLDVLSALQILNETKQQANQILYRLKTDYWRLQVARGNCCESA
jgi:outer membrane protein TolC